MTTMATTAACSATHASQSTPLSDAATDEGIISAALLQMAKTKLHELPDREEMHQILCLYGPEKPVQDLDLRFLKPHQCYVEHIFKAWNPTFAQQFYHAPDGEWLPHLGVKEEQIYRQNNLLRLPPRKQDASAMIRLPKGKKLLFYRVSLH
jgi:hypothetical protein